jgi:hypothetical protein
VCVCVCVCNNCDEKTRLVFNGRFASYCVTQVLDTAAVN